MGRWVGVDYGRRRIGLALSDPRGAIASPSAALPGTGTPARDAERLLDWAREHEPAGLVVGMPLNMDGSSGPQAQLTQQFVEALRQRSSLPVETWDERLSSYQADEYLRAHGAGRAGQKRRRDALAAQVILQSFLDARNASTDREA